MFEAEEIFVMGTPAWTVPATGSPMTCIDYDSTGNYVAYSNSPGNFVVVDAYTGSVKCDFVQQHTKNPLTGLRFNRASPELILATSKDGYIFLHNWQTNEAVLINRQLGSNLQALAVDAFGEQFAIGCADGTIRIHDIDNLQRMKACVKSPQRVGQTSNVYCLCFHPEDPNILLSAGWNDRVYIWDIRTGNAERSIVGPHIRGDGIDMLGETVVTASARDTRQIEFWDYGSTKRVSELAFDASHCESRSCLVNNINIARNELNFICGGLGAPMGQLFSFRSRQFIGQSVNTTGSAQVSAISPFGSAFIVGSENGDAVCHMVRVRPDTFV